MPEAKKKIYWDSSVWLSYINGDTDRLPCLDAILADSASDKGSTDIVTSVVAQVEVAFARLEQDGNLLDSDVELKIDSLWADRDAVIIVEFHDIIAKEARRLIREALPRGFRLKPVDAIHLATAKWCKADGLHTYDDGLFKYSETLGILITEPQIAQPALLSEADNLG